MSSSTEYNPVEVRRSFRLLASDAILYNCGLAFLDQSTVLPAFLATLTGSSVLIGAIISIRTAGILLPQMWTAHYLRHRSRHKSFLVKVALISRISMALFAVLMFFAGPNDRSLMLWGFLAMYTAFWFSEGAAGLSWTDLVAKAIPERKRGRLFGLMQFAGGILAILAGIFVSRMLSPSGPAYPRNYAVLAAVSAFFFAASLSCLLPVREPEGAIEDHEGDFLDYVRKIGQMLAGHRELQRFLAVQVLLGFFGLSLPFYILYAKDTIEVGGGMVGIFLSVQMAGSIAASAVTGYLSDRNGPKYAIMSAIFAGIFASVFSLLIAGSGVWMYGILFFAVGWVIGSGWIGMTNYLLELAEPSERKSYLGLMNTVSVPTMVFPILGGLIVETVSYHAVFALTGLAFVVALVLAFGLKSSDS